MSVSGQASVTRHFDVLDEALAYANGETGSPFAEMSRGGSVAEYRPAAIICLYRPGTPIKNALASLREAYDD
jgi:hypothetical protein